MRLRFQVFIFQKIKYHDHDIVCYRRVHRTMAGIYTSDITILPDKNFRDIHGLVVFSIIPRALLLIAVSAVFTMLCKRTTKMLSNLLGAEEQENAAGIREIEKMVRQIDELARTLQTGLASEEKSE